MTWAAARSHAAAQVRFAAARWLRWWAVVLLAGCTQAPAPQVPCADCNVLLLSIDALRSDRLGLYGYSRPTSPHLDAFFANGSVFRNATSAAPCTLTSVKQILTGDYDGEAPRLAQVLRARGFTTAAVVSQHVFRWFNGLHGYAAGFEHFDIQSPEQVDHHRMSTRTAPEVTRGALAWLDAHGEQQRFFLWLHYFDPHDPYEPLVGYRRWPASAARFDDGDRRRHLKHAVRGVPGEPWHEAGGIFSSADAAHFRGLYDGEIAFTDAEVGRVLRRVQQLSRPTLVVLTADHGENLGEGGVWDHCYSTRETELRVPMAFNLPSHVFPAENLSTAAVSTLDLVPTILDVLGIDDGRPGIEGASLRAARDDRRAIALFKNEVVIKQAGWKLRMRRTGEGFAPDGLYDVTNDITEQRDLSAEHPQRIAQLRADARRFFESIDARSKVDRETVEALKALGYTE